MVGNAVGGVVYEQLGPPALFVIAAVVGTIASIAGWAVLPRGGELRSFEGPTSLGEPRTITEQAPTAAAP